MSDAARHPAVPGRVAPALPSLHLDHSYARELAGTYADVDPVPVSDPRLVALNRPLAVELGLDPDELTTPDGVAVLAGNAVPTGARPIAQAYAGHQFGGFNPQLGDGRAVLLGDLVTPTGTRCDLALKGSGRTPFSRGGDGRAALGPVLREFLVAEAMHALGIPTTRALAAVATGDPVFRERALPGAVLSRVAASHLRVGTFEFLGARGRVDDLGRLVDHALARHDPGLVDAPNRALALLGAVAERQAALVAAWMHVGFVHGVMNTDNTAISGETIDYGPCAFLEAYDPAACFSSIDQGGRYAFGNQPAIARWNLARLAEALVPLLDPDPARAVALATEVIDAFPDRFDEHWTSGVRRKLGFVSDRPDDRALADDWLALLAQHAIDHTRGWRYLAEPDRLRELFADPAGLDAWLARWHARVAAEPDPAGVPDRLRAANPTLIARNHHLEAALAAAVDTGDLAPWERLLAAVRHPFADDPAVADLAAPAPPGFTATYRTFCGT